jgi:acyl-CoA dehydrogenase
MGMDFSLSELQQSVRGAVEKICARFDGDYWLERDSDGKFPEEFYRALADDGWLGICIPQAYGGSGLGVTEAALMMQAVAQSGAGLSGASAIHMNIFGLNPVVVYGSEEQKRRMLPPIAAGREKACFAVTEPNAGLETAKIQTRAECRGDVYVIRRRAQSDGRSKLVLRAARSPPRGGARNRENGAQGSRFQRTLH